MMEKVFKNGLSLLVFTALLGFLVTPAMAVGFPIWTENFEDNWQDCWYVEDGTWEVGTPTSGPDGAHGGTNSAATILAGNYSNYVSSRLIRNCEFVVPDAAQNPVLRFWHYYYFALTDNDFGEVQIRVVGDTVWTTLAEYRNHGGGTWTQPQISLSEYAGQTVEVSFYMSSDSGITALGWYIDDISVEIGPRFFTSPEDWESGLDDWYVESGTWEVGVPTSGPDSVPSGDNCVATRLDGNYSNYTSSRLISPPLTVPSADQAPVLRFMHYYYFALTDQDYGRVAIRAVGDPGWVTLAEYRNHGGGIWTQPLIPLSDYADQIVEISFEISADSGVTALGWYIDDISLEVGPRVFTSPEDWESGLDDWYVESGTWEVGPPTSGPDSVPSGDNCVATRLDGSYGNYTSSRLISPPITVPSADQTPVLRFWHYYYFALTDEDYGRVDIRAVGDTDWVTLAEYRNHGGGTWTQPQISLSDYAGQTVEVSFYMFSDSGVAALGWCIDDVSLDTGPRFFTSPEDWESGLRDWYVESGTWEVGVPTSGPDSVPSGENCTATVLDGNYGNYTSSRLISAPFVICPSVAEPELLFKHWYYFSLSDNDYGQVQIRELGDTEWHILGEYRNSGGGVWTQPKIDLSNYLGQTVELSFYLSADSGVQNLGWYIDDVELKGLTPRLINAPLAKYGPSSCPVLISTRVDDPCGEESSYHWDVPENCTLIGAGPEVEVECSVGRLDPYQISLSVTSDTSAIGPPEKMINIFTQVAYDSDADEDIDGSDLRQFANAYVPEDDLARFALEFGLVAVACD